MLPQWPDLLMKELLEYLILTVLHSEMDQFVLESFINGETALERKFNRIIQFLMVF